MSQTPVEEGVLFPRGEDGRRSTAATGRAVWADAVRDVDPALAARTGAATDWRRAYVDLVVQHTAAATRSPSSAVAVARAGLASLASRMVFERGGAARSVAEAVGEAAARGDGALQAETVRGEGERERELVLPHHGRQLRGDALRRQVDGWVASGTVEPSCGAALTRLLDEPDLLDVSGRAFALLGAGAEMGPLEALSRWGAHVVAVDVPSERVWERVRRVARAGAGTLTVPGVDGVPGVDLLTRAPEVAGFLRGAAEGLPLTVGSYAYADGARHVQVVARQRRRRRAAAARAPRHLLRRAGDADGLVRRPGRRRGGRAAPLAGARRLVGAAARRRGWPGSTRRRTPRRSSARTARRSASPTSSCRSRAPTTRSPSGCSAGGPSSPRPTGCVVSANVAPATRTRSVTRNRLLAAAYAGAGRFGVEVFAPATSRVLMAALLVHDLRGGRRRRRTRTTCSSSGAAHGGLWRVGYSPRSVLGLAAVTGLPGAAASLTARAASCRMRAEEEVPGAAPCTASERTVALADALAELLRAPLADPFAPEVVAVPAQGVERWLAQRLSTVLGAPGRAGDGVCAGVDFPSPARLVDGALAAATGGRRGATTPGRAAVWPLLRRRRRAAWASRGARS